MGARKRDTYAGGVGLPVCEERDPKAPLGDRCIRDGSHVVYEARRQQEHDFDCVANEMREVGHETVVCTMSTKGAAHAGRGAPCDGSVRAARKTSVGTRIKTEARTWANGDRGFSRVTIIACLVVTPAPSTSRPCCAKR